MEVYGDYLLILKCLHVNSLLLPNSLDDLENFNLVGNEGVKDVDLELVVNLEEVGLIVRLSFQLEPDALDAGVD